MKVIKNSSGDVVITLETSDEVDAVWAAIDHRHIFDLEEHDRHIAVRRKLSLLLSYIFH